MSDNPQPVSVVAQFAIRGGRFAEMAVGRDLDGDIFIKTDSETLFLDNDRASALAIVLLDLLGQTK